MKINFYWKNAKNIGDVVSSPMLYFQLPFVAHDFSEWEANLDCDVSLFGGGMLLKRINKWNVLQRMKGYKIGWGIGNAMSAQSKFDYSDADFISEFDMLGVRDYGVGLPYVPCSSCMMELFDTKYEVTKEIVFYQNSESMPLDSGAFSKLGNDCMDVKRVISFLGSAQTVVTSSYHGVYWSMLLGKRVVAVPFNSKFYSFRHEVVRCRGNDWRQAIRKARSYDGFLEECRELNNSFYDRIMEVLA